MAFEIPSRLHSYPLQGFGIVERDLSHYGEQLLSNPNEEDRDRVGGLSPSNMALLTACVCQIILLALDSVFQAFCFSSCSRDFGLHLFSGQVGRHSAGGWPSRTRLMIVHR